MLLKAPGTKRLKLKCDVLLSTSAVKLNLRRYIKEELVLLKRRSEDQNSKARTYTATLKKSLDDAEKNLDKLKKERAEVFGAARDAHHTAAEAGRCGNCTPRRFIHRAC